MASAEPAGDGSARIHVIAPGETLMQLSRIYQKSLSEIARANNIAPSTRVKVGDRIAIPGAGGHVGIAAAVPPADARIASPPMQRIAAVEPPQTTRVATASVMPEPEPVTKLAEPAGAMPSFRWPVRARVIAGFGPKPNGLQNDGINLAVPEGTPIKSAEDGVVAYAGNELKGYGNLVLVRHAHGFVTAYAHASEILVKRGDQVKRGQVIVKSGQTGNVSSPQLHFEIRKGSTPVDPTQYLNGA
jgi:murein DD-endopeptidase MepM/ murein hydrolase activator NlpD